jgi:hypothetical protein
VEIKGGLQEGDEVVLNPASILEEEEADAAPEEESARDGESPPDADAAPPAKYEDRPQQPSGKESRGRGAKQRTPDTPDAGRPGEQPRERDTKGRRRGPGGFQRMDRNQDGKISKDEVPEAMHSIFDRLDRNQDGVLDAQEMRATSGQRRGGERPSKARPRSGPPQS